MHHRHQLDPATHTVELDQLRALNTALAAEADSRPSITAMELGMTGVGLKPAGSPHAASQTVPADARLVQLTFDGPPEFPYIHGHFTGDGIDGLAEMHTAALKALARQLHLQQRWGV